SSPRPSHTATSCRRASIGSSPTTTRGDGCFRASPVTTDSRRTSPASVTSPNPKARPGATTTARPHVMTSTSCSRCVTRAAPEPAPSSPTANSRQDERMRHSERMRAVTGAVVVAAVAVAVAVGLAGHAPHAVTPASADDRVPEDLFWPWVASCGVDIRRPLVSMGYNEDGVVDISVGMLDPDAPYGTPLTDENGNAVVDAAASQAINSCLSAHRLAPAPRTYREGTAAERLLLYEWTARWQAPCLRA